jgi:hypothetical protein
MTKSANVMTQAQVSAACKGALAAGAKSVTVEATLPNGTKLKVTARAEDAANGGNRHEERERPNRHLRSGPAAHGSKHG